MTLSYKLLRLTWILYGIGTTIWIFRAEGTLLLVPALFFFIGVMTSSVALIIAIMEYANENKM